jgi:hypothetical protein
MPARFLLLSRLCGPGFVEGGHGLFFSHSELRLLVAGLLPASRVLSCGPWRLGTCPLRFEIVVGLRSRVFSGTRSLRLLARRFMSGSDEGVPPATALAFGFAGQPMAAVPTWPRWRRLRSA